jgi:hypothetical protein
VLQALVHYVKTNKLEGSSVLTLKRVYSLLKQVYVVLEKRSLDRNDARILFELTVVVFEELIIKQHNDQDTFPLLKEQINIIEALLKQPDIAKQSDSFLVLNLKNMILNYEIFM